MRWRRALLWLETLERRDLLSGVVHIDSSWVQQAGGGPILLTQANTQYILDTDIRVAGTAFVVGAPSVALNLNGHQVIYGDSPPVQVANGGFEQANADGSLPGWDLSRAPAAVRAPAITGLWGAWMLQMNHFSTTQTIVSDPVTLPQINHEYAATITPKGTYTATVQLSVIDATTGAVLGTAVSPNTERGFSPVASFTPLTLRPVRLQIDVIPAAGSTATMALDYAAIMPSRDYGIVASPQWTGQWPAQLQTSQIQAVNRNASDFTVTGGTISQGQGRGNVSAALYLQEIIGFTVNGITTVVDGMNTSNLDANWARDGVVRNSTFRGAIDRVSNRMQVVAAINLGNFDGTATVTGNRIAGVPQLGILFSGMTTMQSVTITNNDIRQNAIVSDGYGIDLAGVRNFDVGNNTIMPVKGRGILVDGWGRIATENGRIHDNAIEAYEEPNLEYAASGLDATALRMRNWDSTQRNVIVSANTFAARTGPGGVLGAVGVRWSGVNDHDQETGANNVLRNNLLKAIVTTTDPTYSATALAISVVGAGTGLVMSANVLESNDTGLSFGDSDSWQSTDQDVSMPGNTIRRSDTGPRRPFTSVVAGGYQTTVTNIRLTSTYLENGAPASVTIAGANVSNIQTDWRTGPPPSGDATGGSGATISGGGDGGGGGDTHHDSGDGGGSGGSGSGGDGMDHSHQGGGNNSGNHTPRAIFMIGADGQVWTAPPDATGGWSGWSLTQPGRVKSLSVAYDGAGNAQVFVIGLDDQIWTEAATGAGGWNFWSQPVAGTVKALSAVATTGGLLQLFVIGLDNQVWTTRAMAGGTWSGWSLTQPGKVKSISAATDAAGRPEVFVIGQDDQAWCEMANDAGGWGGWTLTQAGVVKSISATTDATGRPEVFAIGLDDEVWCTLTNLTNLTGQGSGWMLTQSGAVKGLNATTDPQGRLEVLVIGQDDQVWCEMANGAAGWGGWIKVQTARSAKLAA